eukprot:322523-Pleurochrysis_carterae.AAC.3
MYLNVDLTVLPAPQGGRIADTCVSTRRCCSLERRALLALLAATHLRVLSCSLFWFNLAERTRKMIFVLVGTLLVAFLIYVCCFGGSSTGVIGRMHRALTSCGCFGRCLGKICGKRCAAACEYVDDVCCWRPNPLLQLFYLSLMGGGFILYYMHCLPHIPNTRLSAWHRLSSYAAMLGGFVIFFLASFCDPGTVTSANLHRFSTVHFDNVVRNCPSRTIACTRTEYTHA